MSARDPTETRLPDEADRMLASSPAKERSAAEWEGSANAIYVRLRNTTIGSTSSELLDAPLPQEAGEPVNSPNTMAMEEPRLADIARAAIADGAPLVSQDVARDALRARARPSELDARRFESVHAEPRVREHEAAALSEIPRPIREVRRPGFAAGMLGGAALAFAAAAALYVTVQHRNLVPSATSPMESERAFARPAPPVAPRAGAASPALPQTDPRRLDDLPMAKVGAAPKSAADERASEPALSFHVKRASKDRLTLERRTDEPKQNQEEAPSEALVAVAPAPTSPAARSDGPDDNGVTDAQPSVGAVQAAIGSVMVGARSCLAGAELGSRAQLTFGDNGRVQSVVVTGPAAGTPAEACLRSALMSARIPPFSGQSFTAALTVRPP